MYGLEEPRLRAYWRALSALRSMSRSKPFDVVHAQFGHLGPLAVALGRRLAVVVTLHDDDLLSARRKHRGRSSGGWLRSLVSRWSARRADEAIVVRPKLGGAIRARGCHVLPYGLPLDELPLVPQAQARLALGLAPDTLQVLWLGDAGGDSPAHAQAQAAVAAVHLPKAVTLLALPEETPVEHIALAMNACDALLVTTDSPTTAWRVREALACNLPVVAAAVPGVVEIVDKVPGCHVVQEDGGEALGAGLAQTLASGRRLDSREQVAALSEQRVAGELIGIYQLARATRTA